MPNTYVLAICCSTAFQKDVGSIGKFRFDKGWYGYVGSSRTDDFKRLQRHRAVSNGSNDTRHWHIDYLIGDERTKIYGAFTTQTAEECDVATSLCEADYQSFGCSDCGCHTHLMYEERVSEFADKSRTVLEDESQGFEWVPVDEF